MLDSISHSLSHNNIKVTPTKIFALRNLTHFSCDSLANFPYQSKILGLVGDFYFKFDLASHNSTCIGSNDAIDTQ